MSRLCWMCVIPVPTQHLTRCPPEENASLAVYPLLQGARAGKLGLGYRRRHGRHRESLRIERAHFRSGFSEPSPPRSTSVQTPRKGDEVGATCSQIWPVCNGFVGAARRDKAYRRDGLKWVLKDQHPRETGKTDRVVSPTLATDYSRLYIALKLEDGRIYCGSGGMNSGPKEMS